MVITTFPHFIETKDMVQFKELYKQLSSIEQLTLDLKAGLYYYSTQTHFLQCLNATGTRRENGYKYASVHIKETLLSLQKKGFLQSNDQINDSCADIITIEALKNRNVSEYFALFDDSEKFLTDNDRREIDICRRLRLAIIVSDKNAFQKTLSPLKQDIQDKLLKRVLRDLLRNITLNFNWFKQIDFFFQKQIFNYKLNFLIETSTIPDLFKEIVDFFIESEDLLENESLYKMLAHYSLYDFSTVINGSKKSVSFVDSPRLEIRQKGCFAFLQNDRDKALKLFDTAYSKGEAFTGIEGIYYILALFQKGEESSLDRIEELRDFDSRIENVRYDLGKLHRFITDPFSPIDEDEKESLFTVSRYCYLYDKIKPLSGVLGFFIGFVLDKKMFSRNVKKGTEWFSKLKKTFPGRARILSELLDRAAPAPLFKEYREETKALSTVSFANLINVETGWKASLEALESFFDRSKQKGRGSSKASKLVSQDRQLVWLINRTDSSFIQPVEQKQKGKGRYTKGRNVALKRLHARDSSLDYLTKDDYRVIACVVEDSYRSYGYLQTSYHIDSNTALMALVGHPKVADVSDPFTFIELVEGKIELVINENKEDFNIKLSNFPQYEGILLVNESSNRIQVIQVTSNHVRLGAILGEKNQITIPKKEKKRIVNLLKHQVPGIAIQSDIDRKDIPSVKGRATPNVYLTPINGGLTLNLFVHPFGDKGPHIRPGKGKSNLVSIIDGQHKKAKRNLEEEMNLANHFIDSIDELSTYNEGSFEWIFEEPLDALNVLQGIDEYKNPIQLHWPEGRKWVLTKPVSSKSLTLKAKSSQDWLSLEGSLQIDNKQVIELKELLSFITDSFDQFIPLGEDRFLTLTSTFKKQLQELHSISERGKDGSTKVSFLGTLALEDLFEESGKFKADKQWQECLKRRKEAENYEPEVPSTLNAELRNYQLEGFKWMSRLAKWGVGACLADDMGLGKTVQALALVLEYASKGPTLVVAPSSVCYNWIEECQRFAPQLNPILFSNMKNETAMNNLGPMDIVIVSYHLLTHQVEKLTNVNWKTAILDEAQYIKNAYTKRSQSVMQLKADNKLVLTGTPIENHLGELWNLFQFINPGFLGSWKSFQERFLNPIERSKDVAARHALKKMIQPFILRRLKNKVLEELPLKEENTLFVQANSEEKAFYEALRQKAMENLTQKQGGKKLHAGKMRIQILSEITKLRRACCHPSLVHPDIQIPSKKLELFMELVNKLKENKHKALVFSQFVGFLEKIREVLDENKISYQYLDGNTAMNVRKDRVNAFQRGEGELFLISLRAGGTGLNLTAADYVIHMDPWWNPAVEDQASDRAHRIGQERPVTVYRLITAGSIEEKIFSLHNKKRALADDLLSGTDTCSKLTEEDLVNLIKE